MKRKLFNRLVIVLLLFVIAFCPPFVSLAAEKNVSVTLDAKAKDITFKITFSKAGDYSAVLNSPKGDTYEYAKVDGITYTCDIDSAEAGEWITTVSSEGEVPKYSLSVNAKKETATSKVSDAVSVGRDIIGLQVYFKDNTVCISWADTTIGKVEVGITNLDTSEVLYEEDIDSTKCEYELPEGVRNISVSVVPTESRNVDGAKSTYTYAIPSRPSSTVEYDIGEYTNKNSVDVSVHLDDTYSFYAEVNGSPVYTDNENKAGEYTVSIPVVTEGENEIKFYLVDGDGNMYSYCKTVILDTVAPSLELEREYDHASTKELNVTINGNIKDYDSFTINGEDVAVTSDGTFSHPVTLHVGDNLIDIVALDQAGNESAYHVTIVGLKSKTAISPIIPIVIAIILVLIIIVFFITKKMKKERNRTELTQQIVPRTSKETMKPSNSFVKANKSIESRKTTLKHKKAIKTENRGSDGATKRLLIEIAAYVFLFFILFRFVVAVGYISSGSMEPTLMTGDYMVENRLAYLIHEVRRGDVVSFRINGSHDIYCKRIIGIAGDHIEFHDGYVYLNGELLDESAYLGEDVETNCILSFDVPEDCVFVLGDNREKSTDSRFWENPYVPEKNIKAKYLFSIPLSKVF